MNQQLCWRAGLRQTKHMVTGSTPWSRFISICLLSHYMKDTLLRLPELISPKPNRSQVLNDVVIHTLNTLFFIFVISCAEHSCLSTFRSVMCLVSFSVVGIIISYLMAIRLYRTWLYPELFLCHFLFICVSKQSLLKCVMIFFFFFV